MQRMIMAAMAACLTGATALAAQPAGQMQRGPMSGPLANTAEFLLSQTGELRLTDAQVTRLAAIARRSAERRRAMRERLDSLRPERTPGARPDSATRAQLRQRAERMRPQMERLREQMQADRRDAIAVLTPDQQGQAWERVAIAGRAMRAGRGPRGMGMRREGMRRDGMHRGEFGHRGSERRRFGPPDGAPRERRPGMPGAGPRPAEDR
jgi:Spy/CpxP family protein refolding chaperone